MINFNFSLRNPFSDRWANVYSYDKRVSKNKAVELEVLEENTIVSLGIRITAMQDHAGVNLELGLLGYSVSLHFYDTRHWDETTSTWAKYD
jgi:hypothetical protein